MKFDKFPKSVLTPYIGSLYEVKSHNIFFRYHCRKTNVSYSQSVLKMNCLCSIWFEECRGRIIVVFCCANIQEMAFYRDHSPRLFGIPIYIKRVKI